MKYTKLKDLQIPSSSSSSSSLVSLQPSSSSNVDHANKMSTVNTSYDNSEDPQCALNSSSTSSPPSLLKSVPLFKDDKALALPDSTSLMRSNSSNIPLSTNRDIKLAVAGGTSQQSLEYLYLAVFFKSHNAWSNIGQYWLELHEGLKQVHECLKIFCEKKLSVLSSNTGFWREMTKEFYFEKGLKMSMVMNNDSHIQVTGKGVGLSVAATTAVGIGYSTQNKFAVVCDVPQTKMTAILCNTDSLLHHILEYECGIKLNMISSTDFLLIILFDGIASIVERNKTAVKRREKPKSSLKKTSLYASTTSISNENGNVTTNGGQLEDIKDGIDIAEANALANVNLLRVEPGSVPISDVIMSSEEMQSLLKKVLVDFKTSCQLYQIGYFLDLNADGRLRFLKLIYIYFLF